MLHIYYTHIVTQGKQIFIVYVGGCANAVKYGSTLNIMFSVGYFFCLARNVYLLFDGKPTAQSSTFCSVTDVPRMRLRNNVVLACALSVKAHEC